MKVSIIIPTRNAENYIKNLIDKLLQQSIAPMEIIVIDTNSKDKTESICKLYEKIEFMQINDGEFDHGGTRNLAARHASGDVLVYMTQDAVPKDNLFIEELIKPLGIDNIVATYARQIASKDASELEIFSRDFNYEDIDIVKSNLDIDRLGVKTFFFSNVSSAFLAKEFWKVGGFPEKTIMNEDMIIAAKFIFDDKKTCYASKSEVIHSHNYSYIQQFKRNFDVGVVFADSSEYFANVKSESEGVKFVKEAIKYLKDKGKIYLIPHLIIQSGFKYMGYKLGSNYKKIPMKYVKKMSMHSFYFDEEEKVKNMGAI